MSVATRSQSLENSRVKDLVGLSNVQLKMLKDDYLINTLQDLALPDKADIDSILGADKDNSFHANLLLYKYYGFHLAPFLT
eukprot:9160379-Ditylum_brightwellii.AAC.1